MGRPLLAQAVARSLLPSFAGNGLFVELAPLSDPALVPFTVATLLGLKQDGDSKAPDYRISSAGIECGAAWKKTARDSDREYLSVKLDDPSLPAPIYDSLVKVDGDEGFTLIWSRRTGE